MAIEKETYENSMAGYRLALSRKEQEWREADISGDVGTASEASMEATRIEAEMERYHQRAVRHAQSIRPAAPPNEFGLSAAESEVAKFSGITEKEYAANKAKLHRMRAAGEYPERERN